jgi:hypothetical protein
MSASKLTLHFYSCVSVCTIVCIYVHIYPSLPVMMNNNLGYKYCFPSEISFQITSSLVESSSFNIAATRLSYINAASKRRPKFSSGVLKERYHSLKQFTSSANQETKRNTHKKSKIRLSKNPINTKILLILQM